MPRSPHPSDRQPVDMRLIDVETDALIDELARRSTMSLVVMLDEVHSMKIGADAKYAFAFKGKVAERERAIETLKAAFMEAAKQLSK